MMNHFVLHVLAFLSFCFSSAQDTTTSASSVTASSDASSLVVVTVTLTSTPADSIVTITSYTTTLTASRSSTPVFPTVPYTGQALLVGTCAIPQYTPIIFNDGGQLEVPLVGCSDDRPECCPSLAAVENAATTSTSATTPPPPSNGGGVAPTGVVSMLSQSPLSICPKDFTDIDPICCPAGYNIYADPLFGSQLACYSHLTTTISVPANILASISSAVAATLTLTTTATATITSLPTASTSGPTSTVSAAQVSVIINQVFALGLPCQTNGSTTTNGLSSGAKIGIGVGAGLGACCAIAVTIWAVWYARRRKRERVQKANDAARMAWIGGSRPHEQGQPVTAEMPGGQNSTNGMPYFTPRRLSQGHDKHTSAISSSGMSGTTVQQPCSPGSGKYVYSPSPPSQQGFQGYYPPTSPPLGIKSSMDGSAEHTVIAGEYAQGYMHGVHTAMALQQGQRAGGQRSPAVPGAGYDSAGYQGRGNVGELEGEGVGQGK